MPCETIVYMDALNLLVRGCLGGALIMLILVLAHSKYHAMAGILVFFPVITVVSYYQIGSMEGVDALKKTVLTSLLTVPVLILFILSFYISLRFYSLEASTAIAIISWLIMASISYFLIEKFDLIRIMVE